MSSIKALLVERDGYVRRGLSDRVALVDEQIRLAGGKTEPEPTPVVAAEIEDAVADLSRVETATVKRGPGRPRKAV